MRVGKSSSRVLHIQTPNSAPLSMHFLNTQHASIFAREERLLSLLVIDNAKQPEIATEYGLDPNNVMDYNFEDKQHNGAIRHTKRIGGGDSRFKTE